MASLSQFCRSVIDVMPADYHDSWYIVTATCLIACKQPHKLGGLYHLAVEGASSKERNRINKRLREVLQKAWIFIGIPPVLDGVTALAKAERDAGHDNEGGLSPKWQTIQLDSASRKRGADLVSRLFAHNLAPTFEKVWGSHSDDIQWQQEQVIYGVFLSDHSVLSAVETEMVSLSALMCGGYLRETLWHLRGFRRLGPGLDETKKICKAIQLVAKWCGLNGDDWPGPEDVEHEV